MVSSIAIELTFAGSETEGGLSRKTQRTLEVDVGAVTSMPKLFRSPESLAEETAGTFAAVAGGL